MSEPTQQPQILWSGRIQSILADVALLCTDIVADADGLLGNTKMYHLRAVFKPDYDVEPEATVVVVMPEETLEEALADNALLEDFLLAAYTKFQAMYMLKYEPDAPLH